MNKFLGLLLIVLTASQLYAQKYTISGYINDKNSGEALVGSTIYIDELKTGASTNVYGFYSITLPKGQYTVKYSFIGFDTQTQVIQLNADIKKNIDLSEASVLTDEVTIMAEKTANVQSSQMSTVSLPIKQIKSLPAFMGEVDILKSIQLLPGVQSAGEGNSGFYVRGGGPDQNLILLDEAVVYNASHLFGFFSVFNADAINNVELIKGGMPANYGGRLSSVLDISMKEGNNQHLEGEGGVGVIASRFTLQGPIVKDKSSFIISARRTYLDVLANPFIKETSPFKGSGYYFYDLNAKINYQFSDKDRLFLSGYFGRDVFTYNNKKDGFKVSIPWGNATASMRWNHVFGNRMFVNTTMIYSDYQFSFGAEQDAFELKLISGITDLNAKIDFTFLPNYKNTLKWGVNYIHHKFTPSSVSAKIGEITINSSDILNNFAHDGALYVNDEWDVTPWLKLNGGLRATYFMQVGPFKRYIKDQYGQTIDSIEYAKGEKIVAYPNVEPRFSMRIITGENSSVKASFTQNYQYIHLATLSSASMPTDLWVPSTDRVKPQFSQQTAVGYFQNFADNLYEFSVEAYYKTMDNQIEYAEGTAPGDQIGDNPDNDFVFGKGKSYGLEFFIKKRIGKTTGWLGYTLSKTTRIFPDINNGNEFPAKYDRRHDVSFTATHEFNAQWVASVVFVYATGNAITLPVGRYFIDGSIINEYGPRNSYRMEAYHRADISITYMPKTKRKYESSWNFSVYNVYNHYNPYFIYFSTDGNLAEGTLKTSAKQISLFPVLPSITYNFKF
jgi:hypothetical protein